MRVFEKIRKILFYVDAFYDISLVPFDISEIRCRSGFSRVDVVSVKDHDEPFEFFVFDVQFFRQLFQTGIALGIPVFKKFLELIPVHIAVDK